MGGNDQAYGECAYDCPGLSLVRIQTKVNHYKENWINAQKEGCDLASYEANRTKVEDMASVYIF